MAIKELRETAGFAAVALLLYGAVVGGRLLEAVGGGSRQHTVPFVSDGFVSQFQLVSLGFAIALGFRQSAWEGMRGTYLFLLHRPAPNQQIFLQKILVGLVVLMLVAAVPLLAYGAWADLPGTHPTPFEWDMTLPGWTIWLSLPVVYLGAFLAGLRPAMWRGTRLVPLFAGMAMFAVCNEWEWWQAAAASVFVAIILLSSIHYVADERDYS